MKRNCGRLYFPSMATTINVTRINTLITRLRFSGEKEQAEIINCLKHKLLKLD